MLLGRKRWNGTRGAAAGLLAACLVLAAAVACQQAREESPPPLPPTAFTTEAEWIDLAGYNEQLARASGQVVVVNFWATWCEPCREEFPDLIRLHRRYAGRGLTFLSISLDSPTERAAKVKKFLAEQRPSFPVFIKTAGDADEFINGIDPEWSGALPATFIYDRRGQRRHSLVGQQTFDSLSGLLKPLLE